MMAADYIPHARNKDKDDLHVVPLPQRSCSRKK